MASSNLGNLERVVTNQRFHQLRYAGKTCSSLYRPSLPDDPANPAVGIEERKNSSKHTQQSNRPCFRGQFRAFQQVESESAVSLGSFFFSRG